MAKSKTRDFFARTDNKVELFLKVTHECEAVRAAENIDLRSHGKGHVVTDKTQSGSKSMCLHHCFRRSPFPDHNTTSEFQTETASAAFLKTCFSDSKTLQ